MLAKKIDKNKSYVIGINDIYPGNFCYPENKRKAYMPTLPDNPGVSRIQNESPGLPYG